MRKTVKKIPQRAGGLQATGRRTVAARQLKRLQSAQKLEGRNPTLIASGNHLFKHLFTNQLTNYLFIYLITYAIPGCD